MDLSCISPKFTIQTLEEIVKRAGGSKYLSHEFARVQQKGDSYLSTVYRLKVTGSVTNEKDQEEL